MKAIAKLLVVVGGLVIQPVQAQNPWAELAAIEAEMARQLWISDTVIGYHDLANQIAVMQGQLAPTDADAHLKSMGAWFFNNEGGEAQLADARNRLNTSIASYISAVAGPAFGPGWPGGQQQQAAAQAILQNVNNNYQTFLQQNLDPAALLIQVALVAGWARGEADVANPFFGHLERIRDAYPDTRIRQRIMAASGPLTTPEGAAIPATPSISSGYSPGAELAAMKPLAAPQPAPAPPVVDPGVQSYPQPAETPYEEDIQVHVQPQTDFFDELRNAGYEVGIDRPGMDIESFDLESPDPSMCLVACQDYGGCVAFTYVNPGVQGPNARCWLKHGIPAPVQSDCCISGLR